MHLHGFDCLRRARRGMSMLEAALAVGVFGLIVAIAWTMASEAMGASKKNQFAQQVIAAAEGARDYVRQTDLRTTVLNSQNLYDIGVLPNNLRRGAQFRNIYGGSFNMLASNISISVAMTDVPADACVELLYARLGGGTEARNNMGFRGYVDGSYVSGNTLQTDTGFQAVTNFCRANTDFSVAFHP